MWKKNKSSNTYFYFLFSLMQNSSRKPFKTTSERGYQLLWFIERSSKHKYNEPSLEIVYIMQLHSILYQPENIELPIQIQSTYKFIDHERVDTLVGISESLQCKNFFTFLDQYDHNSLMSKTIIWHWSDILL